MNERYSINESLEPKPLAEIIRRVATSPDYLNSANTKTNALFDARYREEAILNYLQKKIDLFQDGTTPLIAAVIARDIKQIQLIFSTNPSSLLTADIRGRTPLYWAAASGRFSVILHFLLKPSYCSTDHMKDQLYSGLADYFSRHCIPGVDHLILMKYVAGVKNYTDLLKNKTPADNERYATVLYHLGLSYQSIGLLSKAFQTLIEAQSLIATPEVVTPEAEAAPAAPATPEAPAAAPDYHELKEKIETDLMNVGTALQLESESEPDHSNSSAAASNREVNVGQSPEIIEEILRSLAAMLNFFFAIHEQALLSNDNMSLTLVIYDRIRQALANCSFYYSIESNSPSLMATGYAQTDYNYLNTNRIVGPTSSSRPPAGLQGEKKGINGLRVLGRSMISPQPQPLDDQFLLDFYQRVTLGNELFQQQNYPQAIKVWEKALKQHATLSIAMTSDASLRSMRSVVEQQLTIAQNTQALIEKTATWGCIPEAVPGDGNCLFHAVIAQLSPHHPFRLQISEEPHAWLRQQTTDHIAEHKSAYTQYQSIAELDRIIKDLRVIGNYADHLAVAALSRLLQRTIVLFDPRIKKPEVFKQSNNVEPILLGFETRGHYQIVKNALKNQPPKYSIDKLIAKTPVDVFAWKKDKAQDLPSPINPIEAVTPPESTALRRVNTYPSTLFATVTTVQQTPTQTVSAAQNFP